eukprot:TRINITY_DN1517_c0_g1_i1.p1 TRINITY_DN1517_c0_g1~~TRINITY_DN1517_c0_g1_i1.p1  ORF type:complete len:133 (-),score=30.37 TRINITY_DN1517_c0_g1_i1:161-559(-)
MRKYPLLFEILKKENILTKEEQIIPEEIPWEDLELAHSKEYIDKFRNGLSEQDERRLGVPATPKMLQRWRMTVAGTVDAAFFSVLNNKITGNISGGYHHSHASFGHGFCAFNGNTWKMMDRYRSCHSKITEK